MDLDALAIAIRGHASIKKKFAIHDVLKILEDSSFNKEAVFKGIGEDAAAVEIGDKIVLVATDMISSDLVKRAPFSAGYSAILVCVDDIYACGGRPLTAAIDVQASKESALHDLVKGAKKAAEQFNIPITRGHTSINDAGDVIACTLVGTHADKQCFVSAGDARPGDLLVLIWDPDGKRSTNGPYWDTVTFKSREDVLLRRELMVELSGSRGGHGQNTCDTRKLLRASKDISDAGLFGTAFLMANYSRVGCDFDAGRLRGAFAVDALEDLVWFTTAFLTTGFITAIDQKDVDAVQRRAKDAKMHASVIGHVVPGSEVAVVSGNDRRVLLDWRKTPVFPEPRPSEGRGPGTGPGSQRDS